MLPFPDRFQNDNAWQNEVEAQKLLGNVTGELLSIKVRPISAEGWDRYVYSNEYATIWAALGPAAFRAQLGAGRTDNAGVYRTDSGDFVVAEHETGPEVVALLAVIAASLGLAEKLVGLIKTIIETIQKHAELKKTRGEDPNGSEAEVPGERYFGVDGFSIEVRSRRGGKRISAFQLSPGTQMSEKELLAALRAVLPK